MYVVQYGYSKYEHSKYKYSKSYRRCNSAQEGHSEKDIRVSEGSPLSASYPSAPETHKEHILHLLAALVQTSLRISFICYRRTILSGSIESLEPGFWASRLRTENIYSPDSCCSAESHQLQHHTFFFFNFPRLYFKSRQHTTTKRNIKFSSQKIRWVCIFTQRQALQYAGTTKFLSLPTAISVISFDCRCEKK